MGKSTSEQYEEAQAKNKTLENVDTESAKANVSDLETHGDPNAWKLLSKAWSDGEGWMKSTKGMNVPGDGVLIQVSTQQGDNIAEALTFVPMVKIERNEEGFFELVPVNAVQLHIG